MTKITGGPDFSVNTEYNWKLDTIDYNANVGYSNINMYAMIDANNSFSCALGSENDCYTAKLAMSKVKNLFLEYISTANIDIENIK